MPEMFDIPTMAPIHYAKDSPLRPELVESLYHLYSVTRHPSLLAAGREIADAIEKHSRVRCGYASIADVTTKRCACMGAAGWACAVCVGCRSLWCVCTHSVCIPSSMSL